MRMLGVASTSKGQIQAAVIAEGAALSIDQQLMHLQPVTEAEIKEAIWSIPTHKSPGVDSYGSGFYRQAWTIVGAYVIRMVQMFFKSVKLLKDLNDTHLTLLPKSEHPRTTIDYKPIAYCGVLYKAIANNLSKKLQLVFPL